VKKLLNKLNFEQRLLLLILLSTLPQTGILFSWLYTSKSSSLQWTIACLVVLLLVVGVSVLYQQVVHPLRTISNLLASLREEDFSTRAKGANPDDALGQVFLEINTLSSILQEQRLGALEATSLLRTVMEEIDVAVFTFDHEQRLKLVNRTGQKLLGQPAERLLDRTADELKLAHCLEGEPVRTLQGAFPGGLGRWSMRRSTFWQSGRQRHLLVMADLSRALREEERQAWQRLVRVLGHEINNSLTPIKSISGSLSGILGKEQLPLDWREDLTQGLSVIASRAEALARFMAAYTRLARLPIPKLQPVDLAPWLQRLVGMEVRLPIALKPGPDVIVNADSDQLEQLVINLLRNAVDATLEAQNNPVDRADGPPVTVAWKKTARQVQLEICDSGPGLANAANLFVPFFTTKQGGSGIGLVLSRQIAEAHGGTLTLENRTDAGGCVARLILPLT
jgi:two-component system, NtrC family, nitrogen regulation sensor histidine kinase NtrY